MSRESADQYVDDRLVNGYDYINQAWVMQGKYVVCGHVEAGILCDCYGRTHEGMAPPAGDRRGRPLQIQVTTTTTLVREWLFYADGMLDGQQTKRLVARSKAFLQHHA